MPNDFITERKVRFNDCDFYQHVNNSTYLNYIDDNLSDFLRTLYGDLFKLPFLYHMVHASIDYMAEAIFEDDLIIKKSIEKIGNTSITFMNEIVKKKNNKVVVKAKRVGVFLDILTKKTIAVPKEIVDFFNE